MCTDTVTLNYAWAPIVIIIISSSSSSSSSGITDSTVAIQVSPHGPLNSRMKLIISQIERNNEVVLDLCTMTNSVTVLTSFNTEQISKKLPS
jgi:hypothetical protein